MKLNLEYSYDSSPEAVFGLIGNADFRKDSCEKAGASECSVSVEEQGEKTVVRIERTMAAEVPDFIKKLTGSTVTSVQVEKWGPAAADGSRDAEVSMDVKGQPATMRGTAKLVPAAGGSSFTVDSEIKVAIPLVGKRIEPVVAEAVKASLDADVEYGKTKI